MSTLNADKKYNKLKLKNQICFPLYLCTKELLRKYTLILNELDLTYTQYVVMMYYWEKKKSTLKKLSQMILLDSGTLTPVLKKLEAKGYLKRNRSVQDERNLIISITKKGDAIKDKALNIPNQIMKSLNLSKEDYKNLYMLCYKVLFNLQKEAENERN